MSSKLISRQFKNHEILIQDGWKRLTKFFKLTCSKSTSSANFIFFVWILRISRRPVASGIPISTSLSNRPGKCNSKVSNTETNVLYLTFDNEFSGIMYSLFGGRQNIFLTIFSTKFVVKCAAKILKIGWQIKILCPKLFLNRDFALAREIIHDHKLSVLTTFLTLIKSFDQW